MADAPLTQISDAMLAGINGAALRASFEQFYQEFHSLLQLRDNEIRRLHTRLTTTEMDLVALTVRVRTLEGKVGSGDGQAESERDTTDQGSSSPVPQSFRETGAPSGW